MRLISTIQQDRKATEKQIKLLEKKLNLLINEEAKVMDAIRKVFYG